MKRIKLFCIPYSGGSAQAYLKWKRYLSNNIELCPVEIAGRGKRICEPLYNSFEEAIEDITSVIVPQIEADNEYAILGHSMGSLLAFETYYKLMERGYHKPVHMFFSGRKAPQNVKDRTAFYRLSDEEFLKTVFIYGGNTEEVMKNEELLKLFLPILRADFKVTETYEHKEKSKKITCDITVINGREDLSILEYDMSEWNYYAGQQCNVKTVQGGHFFVTENCIPVIDIINNVLDQLI